MLKRKEITQDAALVVECTKLIVDSAMLRFGPMREAETALLGGHDLEHVQAAGLAREIIAAVSRAQAARDGDSKGP